MASNQHKYKSSDSVPVLNQQTYDGPRLCANGCGFYGSSETENLCSKCYRDFCLKNLCTEKLKNSSSFVDSATDIPSSVQSLKLDEGLDDRGKSKKQCNCCNKRLRMLNEFKCRCGNIYCSEHRLPEKHCCSFDYKTPGRNLLAKSNPIVKADKLYEI